MTKKLTSSQRTKIRSFVANKDFRHLDDYLQKLDRDTVDVAGVPFQILDWVLSDDGLSDWTSLSAFGKFTSGAQPRLFAAILQDLQNTAPTELVAISNDTDAHPITRFEAMGWAVYCQHGAHTSKAGARATKGADVFQFWDQDVPPADVAGAIQEWRGCSNTHHLYSDVSAAAYIRDHFGASAASEFAALDHPALRSDVFRLYRLAQDGGLYCDADSYPQFAAAGFPEQEVGETWAASMTRYPNCAAINGFMAAPAKSPFIERYLDQVLRNIKDARARGIFWLSGPGALTTLLFEKRGTLDVKLLPYGALTTNYFKQFDASYKTTSKNWRVFEHSQGIGNERGLQIALKQADHPSGKNDDGEKLRRAARQSFEILTQRIGQDAAPYKCTQEWLKNDPNRLHILQRYDASNAKTLMLKHASRPMDEAAFSDILAAHNLAQTALETSPVAGVPKILAQDASRQSYVMEYIPGDTVLSMCREQEDHTAVMQKVGAWLAAYHKGTFQEDRTFQPKFMAQHVLHLAGQLERGERNIDGKKRFIELAMQLQDHVPATLGHTTKISAKHGDLNIHNLMIAGQKTYALDFLGISYAPVAYDIARVLLSYVQMVGDVDQIPNGQIVPPDITQAFWSGYDFIDQDDPSVQFLQKTQILMDWNRMPRNKSLDREIRFARLKKIARRAFGPAKPGGPT